MTNTSNRFFTADLHLNHTNIIKYCNRTWRDAEEMNEALIDGINSKVGEEDELYILGDFGWTRGGEPLVELRKKIRCKTLILVLGNHDHKQQLEDSGMFAAPITRCLSKRFSGNGTKQGVTMNHEPLWSWGGQGHGAWHLCGHVHARLNDYWRTFFPHLRILDVGVDSYKEMFGTYAPFSWSEIAELMAEKRVNSTDSFIENVVHSPKWNGVWDAMRAVPGNLES